MAVQRDKVTHSLVEIIKLLAQALIVALSVRMTMPVQVAQEFDLQPLKLEIREQFSDVRAELRDIDRRVVAVERSRQP